jgi:flagellar basal body rod protein FlgG
MKKIHVLFLLPAIAFLTGCQRNHRVSIPSSGLHAQNTSQSLMVQSLEEMLKNQQKVQAEIAALIKEIHTSDKVQRKLFDQMAMKQDKADVLTSTAEAIDAAWDATQHNIANFDTPGYKRTRIRIQDGIVVETQRNWQQGGLRATNNALDLAIEGEGFFRILQPNGNIAYTRNGSMHLNRDGIFVTSEGNMLDPQIAIPQDQIGITIGSDGTVEVLQSGKSQRQQVGRIELARFQNPSSLEALGHNLFRETPASGDAVVIYPGEMGLGTILSGYLEGSNVNMLEELIQLRILQSWEKGVNQALIAILEE